jgi:hypothetical protein
MEEELLSRRADAAAIVEGPYWSVVPRALSEGSFVDLYEQDRKWDAQVPRTVREMTLAYLIAMADAFVGRWREENDLPVGDSPESKWWYPATEEKIFQYPRYRRCAPMAKGEVSAGTYNTITKNCSLL